MSARRVGGAAKEQAMPHTGVHFPLTTAQQRRLLFETWEASGDVAVACATAHVGRGTFYYWKKRFTQDGYAALDQFASCVPRHTRRTAAEVEAQVITLRQQQPGWGMQRLADDSRKATGGCRWSVPIRSSAFCATPGCGLLSRHRRKRGAIRGKPDGGGAGPDRQRRSVFCAGHTCPGRQTARRQRLLGAASGRAVRHRCPGGTHLAGAHL